MSCTPKLPTPDEHGHNSKDHDILAAITNILSLAAGLYLVIFIVGVILNAVVIILIVWPPDESRHRIKSKISNTSDNNESWFTTQTTLVKNSIRTLKLTTEKSLKNVRDSIDRRSGISSHRRKFVHIETTIKLSENGKGVDSIESRVALENRRRSLDETKVLVNNKRFNIDSGEIALSNEYYLSDTIENSIHQNSVNSNPPPYVQEVFKDDNSVEITSKSFEAGKNINSSSESENKLYPSQILKLSKGSGSKIKKLNRLKSFMKVLFSSPKNSSMANVKSLSCALLLMLSSLPSIITKEYGGGAWLLGKAACSVLVCFCDTGFQTFSTHTHTSRSQLRHRPQNKYLNSKNRLQARPTYSPNIYSPISPILKSKIIDGKWQCW